MSLRNQLVKFRVSDVHLPEPHELLLELHGEDFLTGLVVDLSDSADEPEAFAVIEVAGCQRPLLVSAAHVKIAMLQN